MIEMDEMIKGGGSTCIELNVETKRSLGQNFAATAVLLCGLGLGMRACHASLDFIPNLSKIVMMS